MNGLTIDFSFSLPPPSSPRRPHSSVPHARLRVPLLLCLFLPFRMALPAPAEHAARVARLYRHSLKNVLSWAVNRQLYWEEVRSGGGGRRGRRRVGRAGRVPPVFKGSRGAATFVLPAASSQTSFPSPHTQAEKLRSEFERNRNVSGRGRRKKEKKNVAPRTPVSNTLHPPPPPLHRPTPPPPPASWPRVKPPWPPGPTPTPTPCPTVREAPCMRATRPSPPACTNNTTLGGKGDVVGVGAVCFFCIWFKLFSYC